MGDNELKMGRQLEYPGTVSREKEFQGRQTRLSLENNSGIMSFPGEIPGLKCVPQLACYLVITKPGFTKSSRL